MTHVASAAEMVPPSPAFAYTAKERGWTKLLCSACAVDVPEDDYRVADYYDGTPKPISEADARGMMEGQPLTCWSCSEGVRDVQAPR